MLVEGVQAVLHLPRGLQPAAARALSEELAETLAETTSPEAWNTRFGPDSLFDAWTSSRLLTGLYAANRATLAEVVTRPGWRVIEVGGGDGRLWRGLVPGAAAPGELVLVDPAPEAHARLREALPGGVALRSLVCGVEDPAALEGLPDADLVVCSLTLHHVAGRDAAERAAHGMTGPGKLEVLKAFAAAVGPRAGRVLLNEADIHCELDLAPGDPLLAERILDSYLRRAARALLDEVRTTRGRESHRQRLLVVVHRWCLDQLAVADAPLAERDVYELTVSGWLDLLDRAGLRVVERGFTDPWGLFCRYVAAPRCQAFTVRTPAPLPGP